MTCLWPWDGGCSRSVTKRYAVLCLIHMAQVNDDWRNWRSSR